MKIRCIGGGPAALRITSYNVCYTKLLRAGLADYEIVYVDDGSRDATPEALARAQRAHPRLRVVRHAKSCGQSAAIRGGVAAARFPWIATLDGDGQNDPADIPRLLEAISPGRRANGLELV